MQEKSNEIDGKSCPEKFFFFETFQAFILPRHRLLTIFDGLAGSSSKRVGPSATPTFDCSADAS